MFELRTRPSSIVWPLGIVADPLQGDIHHLERLFPYCAPLHFAPEFLQRLVGDDNSRYRGRGDRLYGRQITLNLLCGVNSRYREQGNLLYGRPLTPISLCDGNFRFRPPRRFGGTPRPRGQRWDG